MEFDGSKSSGYKKNTSGKKAGKNDYLMPNISKLNNRKECIFDSWIRLDQNAMETMLKEQLAEAQKKYREDNPTGVSGPEELNYADVYANTKRILEIKVTKRSRCYYGEGKIYSVDYPYQNPDNPYETMTICPCYGNNLGKSQSDSELDTGVLLYVRQCVYGILQLRSRK